MERKRATLTTVVVMIVKIVRPGKVFLIFISVENSLINHWPMMVRLQTQILIQKILTARQSKKVCLGLLV